MARRWAPRWAKDVFWITVDRLAARRRPHGPNLLNVKVKAKEWVRRSYQVHFSRGAGSEVSSARRFVEGTIAATGIRYLDRAYRHAVERTLSPARLPLLAAGDFRPGSIMLAAGSLGPGGSERQTVTTLLGLVKAGCTDLSLVCRFLNGSPSDFYKHLLDDSPVRCAELRTSEELARIPRLGGVAGNDVLVTLREVLRPLPWELRDVERFALELVDRRPGVLHAWLDDVNVKAGLAAAVVGVPRIVLSVRSVAPANFLLFQPYMKEIYRALAKFHHVRLLSNSEAGARSYEQWLGLTRGRFSVVFNGVEPSRVPSALERDRARQAYRVRHGIHNSCPVLGSVMRFSEEKGPLLWFDTAAEVARRMPETFFLMIGDGPLRERVRQQVELAGLERRFCLPGHDESAIDAMLAMDVFLLTSRLEGLPNVLIEAQAMGIPVVTTDAGGAREALLHGATGYAVNPHTPAALAKSVVGIMRDREFRAAAVTRGPAFVREKFDVQRMVQETLAAYYD